MDGMNVQQALKDYKEGLGKFARHLPQVAHAYNHFTEACFKDGELPKKTKHLIGLSLAAHTTDQYCMIYHIKGALDQGASDQEVLEAAAVTSAFGGGMAMSQIVTIVQSALDAFQPQIQGT